MPKVEISDEDIVIRWIATAISKNIRIRLSLERLWFEFSNDDAAAKYDRLLGVKLLRELEGLFEKYGLDVEMDESVGDEFKIYRNEVENFNIYSERAKSVRNNEFSNFPDLVEEFRRFQESIAMYMTRRLYDRQCLSAFHMAFSVNSCNFAVPGAWKTSIVYAAYTYLKHLPESDPRHVDKLLIIGPISSFISWEDQYVACFWSDPDLFQLSGSKDVTRDSKMEHLYSWKPAEISLIHHGYVSELQNGICDFLRTHKTMVVVDEAHKIKNSKWIWGNSAVEISKYAISRVVLTWTPVPNWYEDIYNLYRFIYPYKFLDILKTNLPRLEDMSKNDGPESPRTIELMENISPFFIRIKKTDLNLPDTTQIIERVPMDENQRRIYDFIEEKLVSGFESPVKEEFNRARLIRLRQAATNPALLQSSLSGSIDSDETFWDLIENYASDFLDDSWIRKMISSYSEGTIPNKFKKIKEIIEDTVFPENGKLLVWTIFIQNAKSLQKYLIESGINAKLLIWEVEEDDRKDIVRKFNDPKDSEFKVVIANPFTVAESISLHEGCHNAAYLERDYNCSNFLQSKDRIHRVWLKAGQLTRYWFLISKDSVDEVIDERLEEKIKRMDSLINGDIPLFFRINENDDSEIITSLLKKYARGT